MCGICGIAGRLVPGAIDSMVDALAHRGPDDRGTHADPAGPISLGHTRLSIVDLSAAGHQPMQSPDGEVWIAFNGEIYNHLDIRRELGDRYAFRGHSDTETILAAYLAWGKSCVEKLNGMFAFAIWDRRRNELWAVRDRLGIKPLYYSTRDGEFRFASEVRAVWAGAQQPEINLDAVDAFLRLRYVPQPLTLFSGVLSLPPGHMLIWSRGRLEVKPYWSAPWDESVSLPVRHAEERFTGLLEESVKLNLMSDVPIGMFLSGGLDSTVVAALAQRNGADLQAFSVAFEGDDDEASVAAETARHLGCSHTIVPCMANLLSELPAAAAAMDQPIGDAVILPMAILNKAASRKVKVVLTGEGADELLMGYAHQKQLLQLSQLAPVMDIPGVSASIAAAARILPLRFWDMFFSYGGSIGAAGVSRMVDLAAQIGSATRRYVNYTSLFGEGDRKQLYSDRMSAQAIRSIPAAFGVDALDGASSGLRKGLMKLEMNAWLPSNILTKQDTLGMAHGLEARVPYLDHRLVEEVVRWDGGTFKRLSRNKDVLRKLLADRWPQLPRRKKQAFRLDFHPAFRPALVRLTEDMVLDKGSISGSLISGSFVSKLVAELDESPFLRGKQIAALVILESWLQGNLKKHQSFRAA